ncbi:hypothetical protein LCGC14_2624850, partial [marine sediment metagenome]
ADIIKTIVDLFLNRYDGFSNYQKLYDITVEFDYTFIKDNSLYPDFAKIYFNYGASQDSFNLIKDGTPQSFSYTFEFDSTTENDFDVKFEISNGQLDLSNMDYSYLFKCIENPSGNSILQQDFNLNFNGALRNLKSFRYSNSNFLLKTSHSFSTSNDGLIYHNTYGRTNKFEIIYSIKADGEWYTSIFSTNTSESLVRTFNITEFMTNNNLYVFQDFSVEFIIIGNNTSLTVNFIELDISNPSAATILEEYRIIDNILGQTTDWIQFNSSTFTKLGDFGDLPANFSIEYRVTDYAGLQGINTTYNGNYQYIIYSQEKSITLIDDTINLNTNDRDISFTNLGQFNNLDFLDVYINGFRYGTAYLIAGLYKVSFGTQNNVDTLLTYSDSLLSPDIYSNIDPVDHVSWDVDNDDYFATVKHVLIDDDIIITNPILNNQSNQLSIEHLYDRG